MSVQSKQNWRAKLANKKYRNAFVSSRISQTIAFQLRVLRQRARLSQAALARELGTNQNAICRMENPRYGKMTISSLRKLATHFDVGLVVRFAPYSEIVDWATNLSTESIAVPDFDHDTELIERKPNQSDGAAALGAEGVGERKARRQTFAELQGCSPIIDIGKFTGPSHNID